MRNRLQKKSLKKYVRARKASGKKPNWLRLPRRAKRKGRDHETEEHLRRRQEGKKKKDLDKDFPEKKQRIWRIRNRRGVILTRRRRNNSGKKKRQDNFKCLRDLQDGGRIKKKKSNEPPAGWRENRRRGEQRQLSSTEKGMDPLKKHPGLCGPRGRVVRGQGRGGTVGLDHLGGRGNKKEGAQGDETPNSVQSRKVKKSSGGGELGERFWSGNTVPETLLPWRTKNGWSPQLAPRRKGGGKSVSL